MKQINTQEAYDALLVGLDSDELKNRLDKILDIRKFEIELYWKRATYFWAFLIAAFTAYGLSYASVNEHVTLEQVLKFRFLIICFGLLISIAFFLVNKASKFWQENWERHTNFSEGEVVGPLYRVAPPTSPIGHLFSLKAAYSASISRIAIYINVVLIFMWSLLFAAFCKANFRVAGSLETIDLFYTAMWVFTLFSIYFLLFETKSQLEPGGSTFIFKPTPSDLDPPGKGPFLRLPGGADGDNRDSSLVVYTITVAIAVSLLVLVFTMDRKNLVNVPLCMLSAALYLSAAILTLLAIEYMIDITSFSENNDDAAERFVKYKGLLLKYNWSMILLVSATILLFNNVVFQFLAEFDPGHFGGLATADHRTKPISYLVLLGVSAAVSFPVVTKWRKDIAYVRRAVQKSEGLGL